MVNLAETTTHDLLISVVYCIARDWYRVNKCKETCDEVLCILALHHIAKRFGIDDKEWVGIIDEAIPSRHRGAFDLASLLEGVDIDLGDKV